MLNYIFIVMIVIGIVVGAVTGNMEQITLALIDSGKEGIELCIAMLGIVGMWTGIMKIAEKSGVVKSLEKLLSPVISFLFPRIPKNHKARGYIAANMAANMLALGWAATPTGIKAFMEMDKLDKERKKENILDGHEMKKASNKMCMMLIINISSIQLIPMTIIAYRSQYGSENPAAIIIPALITTTISTVVGVMFAKIMERNRKR